MPVSEKSQKEPLVIALSNQRGGVGKTSTTINLGAAFALQGKKVLVMDMDQQGSLTTALGGDPDNLDITILDVIMTKTGKPEGPKTELEDIIVKRWKTGEGLLDYSPANMKMARIDIKLFSFPGWDRLVRFAIEDLDDYDVVLLDCPPNLGITTNMCLAAAGLVLIPIKSDILSMKGSTYLYETIEGVRRVNGGIIAKALLNEFDERTVMSRNIQEQTKEFWGVDLLNTTIAKNEAINRAQGMAMHIFEFDPNSKGAKDYTALASEIQSLMDEKTEKRAVG